MPGPGPLPSDQPAAAQPARVLLIPGLDGDPRLPMSAAPRLFPGRRILPFDHRRESCEGGLDGIADRALALLDADPDGPAPAYVCGESFGGAVALALARRHPERVRGLILLSTFGWYPVLSTLACRAGLTVWRLGGDRIANTIIRLWRPISVPGAIGLRCDPALRRAYLTRPEMHLSSYRRKSALSLDFDARPWLTQLACPTFILVGTRDPVVPTSAGRDLARRIPNAHLECLPGGHLVHVVRAAETGERIARWLREVERAAAIAPD